MLNISRPPQHHHLLSLTARHPPPWAINKIFKIAEGLKDPTGMELPMFSSHLWCKVLWNMTCVLPAATTASSSLYYSHRGMKNSPALSSHCCRGSVTLTYRKIYVTCSCAITIHCQSYLKKTCLYPSLSFTCLDQICPTNQKAVM